MCGITGYVGAKTAPIIAIQNLKRLEYRGYDSAGVAYSSTEGISAVRAAGKIVNLEAALRAHQIAPPAEGATGGGVSAAIAHTRWATHGVPSEANSHPHRDCSGRVAVVHNGIFENYAEIRRHLLLLGHTFGSETDTEILAHLIEDQLPSEGAEALTPERAASALRGALKAVTGSYAVAMLVRDLPDVLFAARQDSPLIIGLGSGENFVASDIAAVIRHTREVILMEDGDLAIVTAESVIITDSLGASVVRDPLTVTWDDSSAERGGFEHFMLKEIYEGPATVAATLLGRLNPDDSVSLPTLNFTPERCAEFNRIVLVGCGTAYHAGVVGRRMLEELLRMPVETAIASEFRYSDPILDAHSLVVLISQSGETADTLAAMREATARGAATLAIVNVVGSTLARDADALVLTQAGPEIGVASTKAYLAQLTALALVGVYFQQVRGLAPGAASGLELTAALRVLPQTLKRSLLCADAMQRLASTLSECRCYFFLGRGYDYAVALEAALKLKEISYLHAEAYAAGEMKHGPLALVEPGVTIVGLCTQSTTREKMISNLQEVKARQGYVVGIVPEGDAGSDCMDSVIEIPRTLNALMPIVSIVPLQLLSYYVAQARGCEIDQPRNLAKSVTVE